MGAGPRVLVVADQALIAESVRTALESRGFEPVVMRWPEGAAPWGRRIAPHASYEVGLLLCSLDRPTHLETARALIRRVATRWVVLAEVGAGPLWGAVLDAGAFAVLRANVPLDEVESALRAAARGEGGMPEDESERLRAAWAGEQGEQERFASLTPREREVLELLHQGRSVTEIAHGLGVSPATVRSQVRSVLRKLGVRSQLAAVAAYDAHVPSPRRPDGSSARPGWRHGATT